MDTRQIEYTLKITEENSITRAASKLLVTQSTLNQQLIRLEQELGTPLSHRSRANWHLTEAGETYTRDAEEIVRLRQETYQTIHDLSNDRCDHLSVDFTTRRGINMFTEVCGTFHQLYPNVIIEPQEDIVKCLQKIISAGGLDIALLALTDKDKTGDIYEPIHKGELYLVIPAGHPLAGATPEEGEDYATLDIRKLQYEPFILMDHHFTMNIMLNRIFSEIGFTPRVLFETGNNHTTISIIRANMCCGILPYYYVKDMGQDFCCFHLPSRPTWQFAASYRKGHYLNRPACSFIDLMKKQWRGQATALHTD